MKPGITALTSFLCMQNNDSMWYFKNLWYISVQEVESVRVCTLSQYMVYLQSRFKR